MKWVAQLPPDRIPQARERVLVEWMQSRPEAAAQWVLEQPAGDTCRDLVASAARHFGWGTSPGAAGKFFAQLTAAERVHVRESLRTLPVPEEKRRLLEAAFQTP